MSRTKDHCVRFSLIALGLLSCVVSGCGREPGAALPSVGGRAFDPIAFFDGHTHSWGVIEHRSGTPSESVMTDSHAERDAAGRLRMVQQLTFQDGTSAQRDWVLWRSGPHRFDATANDMAGTARGETNGRMFHWSWVWDRSPGNRLKSVTMNQWMYQMDDGSVTIRTTVTKFGFILAEVTEQFTRL
jgi:hypothetical protein